MEVTQNSTSGLFVRSADQTFIGCVVAAHRAGQGVAFTQRPVGNMSLTGSYNGLLEPTSAVG